jgi:hypothetical protein
MDNQPMSRKAKALYITLLIIVLSCIIVWGFYCEPRVRYSAAIDSASVLDPRTGVSFNLTLGVKSRSLGSKACINPGAYVEVLYHGFMVAASNPAETRRTCAKPRKEAAELPVLTRATMTPLGDLAAEMGQGAAVFDLRWIVPRRRSSTAMVWVCKATRVGNPAVPCGSRTYRRDLSP